MRNHPIYRELNSGKEVAAIRHTTILKSSDIFQWQGIQLDVARTVGWHVDDLMVDGHLMAINLGDGDLNFRLRSETEWLATKLPPEGFWINAEGRPFSIHHDEPAYYASIFVDGRFLDRICGQHHELRSGSGIVDAVLAGIVRTLIAVLFDRGAYSADLADQLTSAFVLALGKRHGSTAPTCNRGGIAPAQLRSLLLWLEGNLHGSLTVRDMAARVKLSPAHFSREFKRSTGRTPWEYVVELRLEKARQLLESGETVGVAAASYGFSDQSHLSRLFKARYGVTPSTFIRENSDRSAAGTDGPVRLFPDTALKG